MKTLSIGQVVQAQYLHEINKTINKKISSYKQKAQKPSYYKQHNNSQRISHLQGSEKFCHLKTYNEHVFNFDLKLKFNIMSRFHKVSARLCIHYKNINAFS